MVKPAQSWDDRKPRITWRGDGQYFAVSSLHPKTGMHFLVIVTLQDECFRAYTGISLSVGLSPCLAGVLTHSHTRTPFEAPGKQAF